MNHWTPAGANRVQTKRPNEGDTVAYAHAAWLVEHVQDAIPTDEEAAVLAAYRPGFREKLSPYRVSLRRLHGPRHAGERRNDPGLLALRVRAGAYVHPFPVYRNGRVPLCTCCGDPWPCLPQLAEDASPKSLNYWRAARQSSLCRARNTWDDLPRTPGRHRTRRQQAMPTMRRRQTPTRLHAQQLLPRADGRVQPTPKEAALNQEDTHG